MAYQQHLKNVQSCLKVFDPIDRAKDILAQLAQMAVETCQRNYHEMVVAVVKKTHSLRTWFWLVLLKSGHSSKKYHKLSQFWEKLRDREIALNKQKSLQSAFEYAKWSKTHLRAFWAFRANHDNEKIAWGMKVNMLLMSNSYTMIDFSKYSYHSDHEGTPAREAQLWIWKISLFLPSQ